MRLRILLTASVLLLACPEASPTTDGGTGGGAGGGSGQAPEITSITPVKGPLAGGTVVTVNGANFEDGVVVKFWQTPGTQVVLSSKRKLTVKSPAGSVVGKVAITVVNPDGQSATLPDAFTYEANMGKAIDETVVLNPATTVDVTGAAMVKLSVQAQVSAGTVTKGAGQGAGVKAQVGVTENASNPPKLTDFTWVDAAYSGDADGPALGDLARDAYKADVSLAGATGMGTRKYNLAARFSIDDGATWVLADRDGSSNGASTDQLPAVTLSRPVIDYCKLGGEVTEAPPSIIRKAGQPGAVIYGQVYRAGVTQNPGQGQMIKGQLGVGAASTDPANWTWVDATYNKDTGGGNNDEYQAMLPVLAAGMYSYAFRFNVDNGPWTLCDADGSTNDGFLITQSGTLTVSTVQIDSCKVQFPSNLDARTGFPTELVYGRIFAETITDGATQSTGLTAEVGYGPTALPPTDASWTWKSAAYNTKVAGGGEEYQASFTGPAAGSYSYGYRFKIGTGAYVNCDLDGNANGFTMPGTMVSKAADIDDCGIESPAQLVVAPSGTSAAITAIVRVTAVTEAAGAGPGVVGEVGYGPVGSTPSTWTTWTPAAYLNDAAFFERWSKTITAPAATGDYDLAYRFKYQSKPYVYCDTDGAGNGYSSAKATKLKVANATVNACNLQFVDQTTVNSGDRVNAYGRVLVTGLSEAAGATPGLRAQFGVGTQNDNASTSALWGWQEAAFNVQVGNEDEFSAVLQPAYTGSRAVSFRVSLDNGQTWKYCDKNGGTYEVAQQHDVLVNPHNDLDFCNTQFPPTLSLKPDGGADVYGQLYEAGGTPNPTFPVIAQLGTGKKNEDPGLAWSWQTASFNNTQINNNEYVARLSKPVGQYHYAYRFSRDGGAWCFADLDGHGASGNGKPWAGFAGDLSDGGVNLGVLNVVP